MKTKIDKKSCCVLTITLILLISLLVNVFLNLSNSKYKIEIGQDVYKSIEEIRTRNEYILIVLDGCLASKSITKEEILTLYKNYNLIDIAELNLWEHYLKDMENTIFEKKTDTLFECKNEVFSDIEELVYTTLLNYMGDSCDKIELDEDLSNDMYVMREISRDLNDYFDNFTENNLQGLEGEERAEKIIKKKYWADMLKGIEQINYRYKDYMFKKELLNNQ